MRIALATQHADRAFIPLALMYLKASVVGRGCCAADDVVLLEFQPDATAETIVGTLMDAHPDVVGLSCYVWNIRVMQSVARLIKQRAAEVRVILGGPEVGPVAAEVLHANPDVDVIVHSEGEVPFADIVDALRSGQALGSIAGIAFRDASGAIVDNGAAALVKRLDEYPSPHLERYVDYKGRIVCIETQRGCVFKCNFCFYNKDYSLRNRRFDLDRVKEELLFALDQDVLEIYLMDPVFNLNAARAKEICRFVAAHNRRRIPIHSEIWAEFVDDEMASLMREAGFHYLEVGLQTTDPTALATTERRFRLESFIHGIAHLRRHGLAFQLQLIYGLPGETPATFRESLNFGMSLDPPELAVFRLMVLPGTELWRKAEALSLTFDPEPPYHLRSHFSMTAGEVEHGRRFLKAANILQASRAIRFLAREPGLSFADIVDEWLLWRPEPLPVKADNAAMLAFIADVCQRHRVPPQFYLAFGERELGAMEPRTLSATRTTSTIALTP